jgi:alkylation response protein AidB-like acyl-CoA dehydrogenase
MTTYQAEWLERARALEPLVRELRDEGERNRELPKPIWQAMREAGLFSMWVPRALGGAEVELETMVRVVEELARQDGSVGWNMMIAGNTSILWSLLTQDTAASIIRDDPNTVLAGTILGGHGVATPVEGGYRVNGHWPFASGCHQADWIVASCEVLDDGEHPRLGLDGNPSVHAFVVPVSDCDILDTWYTTGLRGTGSHDFEINDVFVPEERFFASIGGQSYHPGPLYNTMITNVWGYNVSAVALGIARDALDSFAELAQTKTSSRNPVPLASRELTQARLGEAEAKLRSARAYLYEACRENWALLSAGQPVPLDVAANNRLAYANATERAVEAVEMVYTMGGSAAVYTTSRIERCFRDVHMVTQHGVVGPAGYALAGRCFLGIGTNLR